MATLMTGTPSLSDTTIAWSPSTLGNFLYRNRFRSSAMMNPFLPQDQSPRLGFWVACFSELPLQGQLLGQVPLKAQQSPGRAWRRRARRMLQLGRWWAAGPRGDARGLRPARVCWRRYCGSGHCPSATWSTWTWTLSCSSTGSLPARHPRAARRQRPHRCALPHPPRGPAPAARPPLALRPGTPPPGPLSGPPAATAQA